MRTFLLVSGVVAWILLGLSTAAISLNLVEYYGSSWEWNGCYCLCKGWR